MIPSAQFTRGFRALTLIICCLLPPAALSAQTAANVAVVINESSEASIRIGEHYARQRSLPDANVIRIRTTPEESITREGYASSIERAIAQALQQHGLQDRILFLVLTKGIPFHIEGTTGPTGTAGSVDSELTLLYRRMTGRAVPSVGRIDNPYYLGAAPHASAKPFSHVAHDIYLVTRLDGFSVEDALALIDRATSPSADGRIILDRRGGAAPAPGDLWLADAAAKLNDSGKGDRAELVEALPAPADLGPILGYFSWGSLDPSNRRRRIGLTFVPGAIAAMLAGPDARTFREPPDGWTPGIDPRSKPRPFVGSPHSLLADLVREGVTGAAGNVRDPMLASAVRPEILFPAYLSGFNLAESFYLALPHLSWQSVIVGDPLCRPFQGQTLTQADTEPSVDETTGLPALFSSRRMAVVRARTPRPPESVVALIVRAERELASDHKGAARQTLEQITTLAPDLASQQLQLALLLDDAGEDAPAMARYRRVLELEPKNAAALNNLAYRLSRDSQGLPEALSMAERAATLTPRDPRVLDTLGWIQYQMGNRGEAARTLSEAVRLDRGTAEIRLHAAIVHAAVGAYQVAAAHLDAAVKLDSSFEERDEVRELRALLQKKR